MGTKIKSVTGAESEPIPKRELQKTRALMLAIGLGVAVMDYLSVPAQTQPGEKSIPVFIVDEKNTPPMRLTTTETSLTTTSSASRAPADSESIVHHTSTTAFPQPVIAPEAKTIIEHLDDYGLKQVKDPEHVGKLGDVMVTSGNGCTQLFSLIVRERGFINVEPGLSGPIDAMTDLETVNQDGKIDEDGNPRNPIVHPAVYDSEGKTIASGTEQTIVRALEYMDYMTNKYCPPPENPVPEVAKP